MRKIYFNPTACLRQLALIVLCSSIPLSSAFAGHNIESADDCPQPRFTGKAPAAIYALVNPLAANRRNRRAGKELYEDVSNPPCAACHGKKGDGRGQLAGQFDPKPRNFACDETISGIPDGQLFWIIRNGSPGTAMPPFGYFNEEETWQLVIYLRSLSGHE